MFTPDALQDNSDTQSSVMGGFDGINMRETLNNSNAQIPASEITGSDYDGSQIEPSLSVPTADTVRNASKTPEPNNERNAAISAVVGTGIKAAVDIFSNMANIKAEDAIFMNKIHRGREAMYYNVRMKENSDNITSLNKNIAVIQDLKRQSGSVGAGGQEQLFLKNRATGLNV